MAVGVSPVVQASLEIQQERMGLPLAALTVFAMRISTVLSLMHVIPQLASASTAPTTQQGMHVRDVLTATLEMLSMQRIAQVRLMYVKSTEMLSITLSSP